MGERGERGEEGRGAEGTGGKGSGHPQIFTWIVAYAVYSAVSKVTQLTSKRTNELMRALFLTSPLKAPAYLSLVKLLYVVFMHL